MIRLRPPGLSSGESILALALAAEVAVFAAVAPQFFTVGNAFEVLRVSVELGLLAVALTPVIVSGGIDLSVGAMMGLAAVVFGAASRAWGLGLGAAAALALAVGTAGGAANAALVSRLGIPPLIVTLGSLSLFRGIAEGLTHAAVNYTNFPPSFLALGQGYLWGVIPAQLPIFAVVAAAYAILLHRSVVGRAVYAIGFSPAGARYAGIPVRRRLGALYLLSGFVASLAAIVYVAHMGQARSDAGTGYELDAITAVVLGGTSVFGGRGTLGGTLLGLLALSVLRNGLQLAALPSELAGVLTGTLLLVTIGLDRVRMTAPARSAAPAMEDVEVRNSQVAVLCAAVIAGSLIVAGTILWLVRSLASSTSGARTLAAGAEPSPRDTPAPAGRRPVIAMMPKAKAQPRLHRALDRRHRQRAGQRPVDVRLPAHRLRAQRLGAHHTGRDAQELKRGGEPAIALAGIARCRRELHREGAGEAPVPALQGAIEHQRPGQRQPGEIDHERDEPGQEAPGAVAVKRYVEAAAAHARRRVARARAPW